MRNEYITVHIEYNSTTYVPSCHTRFVVTNTPFMSLDMYIFTYMKKTVTIRTSTGTTTARLNAVQIIKERSNVMWVKNCTTEGILEKVYVKKKHGDDI